MTDIEILSGEASILPGVPDEVREAVVRDLEEDMAALGKGRGMKEEWAIFRTAAPEVNPTPVILGSGLDSWATRRKAEAARRRLVSPDLYEVRVREVTPWRQSNDNQ